MSRPSRPNHPKTPRTFSISSHTPARLREPTIAVDCRLVGYAAGIAEYGRQLVTALAAHNSEEQYVVLTGRRTGSALGSAALRAVPIQTPPHHPLERWALPAEILARVGRVDVLHSIDHVAPAWGPWRSVVTFHDLAFLRLPETHTAASRRYYAQAAETARRADRIIAVSQSTAADLVELLHANPERLRVIYEAAGPEFTPHPRSDLEALAARLGFDVARRYVLFVGTIEPRKNLVLLFEALARLRQRTDVQLLVAGLRGWLEGPIFDGCRRLGLEAHTHFLGDLSKPELATLYSHAAVFAFPSLYEGFGLVLLEAMACGAPVVSSNAGPMPEVVDDAGLLLPPEDPVAWSDALERVLNDLALAADLRARGFRRAASFSWAETARQTRRVYLEALGR